MANEKNIIRGFRDENGNTAKYAFSALAEIPEEFEVDKIQSTVNDIKETKKLANETKENLDTNYYNKSNVDNIIENLSISDEKLKNYYTKEETEAEISEKTYSKAEIDTKLKEFSPDDVYNKTEADEKFAEKEELTTTVDHIKELPISTFTNDKEYITSENAVTKENLENIKTELSNNINELNIVHVNDAWKDLGPFKINGVITTPVDGVIELPADKTEVELSGYLRGCIKIGKEFYGADTGGDGKKLILNNVYIDSPYTSGIVYMAPKKKLSIKLADKSYNYIYCGNKDILDIVTTETDFRGAIYSFNNMLISGTGYLTVENINGENGEGHGIKASELEIIGKPCIYVKANHDAFHAGKKLIVGNGIFTIEKANDAFGTGDNGYILVFGGKYNISGVASGQNCFDSNQQGYILAERNRFNIITNVSESYIYKNMKFINDGDFGSSFGEPKIEYYTVTTVGGEEIETLVSPAITSFPETEYTISTDDQYISQYITSNSKVKKEITIYVYGNFANKEIIIPANTTDLTVNKVNVKLINATIGRISSSDGTKVKLYDLEDESKVNVFYNNSKSPVYLGDDLNMNTDCPIAVIGNSTDASVNCSELALKGDGYRHIENLYDSPDVLSAQGSLVYIGGDEDGASKNSAGGMYIKNLHTRLSSKGKKGNIIIYNTQDNDIILENISAVTGVSCEGNAYVLNEVQNNVIGVKKLYQFYDTIKKYISNNKIIYKEVSIEKLESNGILKLINPLTEDEYEKLQNKESELHLTYKYEGMDGQIVFIPNYYIDSGEETLYTMVSSSVNANILIYQLYGTLTIFKTNLSDILYIPNIEINPIYDEPVEKLEVLKSINHNGNPILNHSYRICKMIYDDNSKFFITNDELIDLQYTFNSLTSAHNYIWGESFETRLQLKGSTKKYSIFSGLNSIGTGFIYDISSNKLTTITIEYMKDTNVTFNMKMELHAYQDGADITDEFISTKLSDTNNEDAIEVYAL